MGKEETVVQTYPHDQPLIPRPSYEQVKAEAIALYEAEEEIQGLKDALDEAGFGADLLAK